MAQGSGNHLGGEAGDPVVIKVTGRSAGDAGTQYSIAAAGNQAVPLSAGKSLIEVSVDSGDVRIRDDGSAATATTGEPWSTGTAARGPYGFTASINIYAVTAAVVTVVQR